MNLTKLETIDLGYDVTTTISVSVAGLQTAGVSDDGSIIEEIDEAEAAEDSAADEAAAEEGAEEDAEKADSES